MADNFATRVILEELNNLGHRPDMAFLLRADKKMQWTRFKRKFKTAGIRATCSRIIYAISGSGLGRDLKKDEDDFWPAAISYVKNVNGPDCRSKIKEADLDLLLLSVDCIVGRGIFSLPKYGSLNAHPGWIPAYRGLGSTLCMLRDGFLPAITVHRVDEGIDTGQVFLRETIEAIAADKGEEAEHYTFRQQAMMFARVIDMHESGEIPFVDTFLEPSNMTRGFSKTQSVGIRDKLKNDMSRLISKK